MNARARFLAAVLALPACGGGPRLTNLRCRASPCQGSNEPELSFNLHLGSFDAKGGER